MFDANVIDKLVLIEKRIFHCFENLTFYTGESRDRELSLLNILFKKEDILISKLPKDEDNVELVLDVVFENKDNYFDEEDESYLVLERFRGILKGILANYYEDDEYYDEEYDLVDSHKNRKIISNNIDLIFIKKLATLLNSNNRDLLYKILLLSIYESYEISRIVMLDNFNFDNIRYSSGTNLARQMDLDDDDYYALFNDVVYDSLESIMSDISDFINKDDDAFVLKILFMKFKLLVNVISNDGLLLSKKLFDGYYKSLSDNEITYYLSDVLSQEFKKRGLIIPECNKTRKKLPKELVDNLIDLIKIEGKIYSLLSDLDFNLSDDDKIFELSILMDNEMLLSSSLCVDDGNYSIIKSVIEEDLSLFLDYDKNDLDVISKRLFNVINFFYMSNISPFQSFESYDNINKKHITNSLKKYLSFYNCSDDYMEELKKILFINRFLTEDFVSTNGNLFMLDYISDDIICEMTGMDKLEYEFDKNEQLYSRAIEIMNYMFNNDDVLENERSFLLCEMENIYEELSLEYIELFDVCELPSVVDEDDVFGKMVVDIVRNNKKIKSIIKR